MRVTGLDGRTHSMDLTGRVPLAGAGAACSAGHARARKLLKKLFPLDRVLEEVTLEGTEGPLRADFFVPGRRLVVEVHGRQHYEYVPHFHRDRLGFLRHRGRDLQKREWCDLNSVVYVELPDTESDAQWGARVLAALGPGPGPGG